MVKFYPPTTDANLDTSKFKRWTYTPYRNGVDVYAPFDGKIYGVDKKKGLVKIKHFFSKDTYTTKFYELGDIYKSNGDTVRMGEIIGKTSSSPFSMEIVDSGNLEQLITPFFTGSVNLRTEPKQEKNVSKEKEIQIKDKETSDKFEKQKEKNKKEKYEHGLKTYEPGKLSLLDVGLVPFHLLGMAGTYLQNRMKRKKAEKENLEEEVQRIKQLIK
jgi:hypothetical protein